MGFLFLGCLGSRASTEKKGRGRLWATFEGSFVMFSGTFVFCFWKQHSVNSHIWMYIKVCQCRTDSSPLTPGTFDDENPDARILTPDPPPDPWRPWSLTPQPLTPHEPWRRPFDARMAFDSPIIPMWPLTPQYPWVSFDAPIPPSGIWLPNTPEWHLTPQYPRVAFDAPIPPGGIWRPNNLKWHLTPGTIFSESSNFFQNFSIPISRILFQAWINLKL